MSLNATLNAAKNEVQDIYVDNNNNDVKYAMHGWMHAWLTLHLEHASYMFYMSGTGESR